MNIEYMKFWFAVTLLIALIVHDAMDDARAKGIAASCESHLTK
jgi:hypothetical protein